MAGLIIPPTPIPTGTPWSDGMAGINQAFKELVSSLTGFAVDNVIAFPDNLTSSTVAAGGMGINATLAVTTSRDDDIVFLVPQVAVYIDPPALSLGETEFDSDYLYPTGAALTSDQLACLISVIPAISSSAPEEARFTGSDGKSYDFANDITMVIRNAGALEHTYNTIISQAVFTKSNSFYR